MALRVIKPLGGILSTERQLKMWVNIYEVIIITFLQCKAVCKKRTTGCAKWKKDERHTSACCTCHPASSESRLTWKKQPQVESNFVRRLYTSKENWKSGGEHRKRTQHARLWLRHSHPTERACRGSLSPLGTFATRSHDYCSHAPWRAYSREGVLQNKILGCMLVWERRTTTRKKKRSHSHARQLSHAR